MTRRFVLATSAVAAFAIAAPRDSGAQASRTADSLLNAGAVARAESLYYAAIRARPRDPMARWALGRYLAERGALRVAATLLEEADQFCGDALA
jgi:Flp pilus assembly protein TadD